MIYTDDNRGKIQISERGHQLIDFSGIRYGLITPTDLDGLIEYKNTCYVLYEMKYRGAKMPKGQELALERLVSDLYRGGKNAVLFVCVHDFRCPEDIIAHECYVERTYLGGLGWVHDESHRNAREMTDAFIEWSAKHPPRTSVA